MIENTEKYEQSRKNKSCSKKIHWKEQEIKIVVISK